MRTLGIDWGERRMGFAVSDPQGIVATPLCTVEIENHTEALTEAARICGETEAECVVVGLPVNMDGSTGASAQKVHVFIEKLREKLDVPVEYMDERLSSALVERALISADMSRERRKKVKDKLAAQVILQSWLDCLAES